MKNIYSLILLCCFSGMVCAQQVEDSFPFRNMNLPMEERVKDLISRLTLEEKVQLMKHDSPAIPRLGIPAYNWWNEALHGVARTPEKVTVFPQAIGMAATFDTEALRKVGDIAATEGRALFNEALKAGKGVAQYRGLTYWTPNINIFRDPRWGRGQETYGEDPYLTARMGSAMVRGLEGEDPHYLKAVACAKHYAVHSGPEYNRHSFDARPSVFDLWDTYLPAFRELVTKAKVHGVMCAYNRLDGQPCCGNDPLLVDILRNQWRFDGYVTSDCWAVKDFAEFHKTHANNTIAASDAMLAGTDLECGNLYQLLAEGVQKGLHSERDINVSLTRLFTILFKLGMFDSQDKVPYASIGREVIECESHKQHAYRMAQESMVLLKNDKKLLPLNPSKVKRIALIGPNADDGHTLLANYYGTPSEIVTPYMSLKKRFGNQIKIDYFPGTGIVKKLDGAPSFAQIASEAKKADVIVFVGGISADYEGEAGDAGAGGFAGFASGDRTTMSLPPVQTELLKALKKTGRPLVVVNMSGSVMSFEWESRNADAILQAWYGGQAAGDAVVDVLFGEYNPAGRMPLTTYKSDDDLPPFESYSMENRTYRYFKGEVRYPFGYGLSYTTFAYGKAVSAQEVRTGESIEVSIPVKNTGKRDGDEVAQLYVVHPQSAHIRIPVCSLKGFKRIHLKAGEEQLVTFALSPDDLALTDVKGNLIENAGEVELFIGGGQPGHTAGETVNLKITGDPYQIY
ncbi:glycoside hydrolase family 3 C-terminal domain-containing protein [Phocaeicola sp.]|uniref:glycoside hydrolase family 3 C-terminal domain-containing protein n=1 Tax=Phocaeicola sp. TaxID=2773926 RepID=UPI0023D617EA|nr:glycoside hydrolase family 3 C-terminal domain-containing protein [Phocaeicola sp.]MDE5678418.1 glycoside hydrolase family 3 C-terminal domain-containing protein [Phocaeicola sp.]